MTDPLFTAQRMDDEASSRQTAARELLRRLSVEQQAETQADAIAKAKTLPPLKTVKLLDYQKPPPGRWSTWLFMAGRGTGKNVTGSDWSSKKAEVWLPGSSGLLIGPTFRAVREVMVEGPTGILKTLGDRVEKYNRSTHEITTATGSRIYMRSADEPESLRGLNLDWAWCDELGSWAYATTWHEGLVPAMRLGDLPQVLVTTTPRPTELVAELAGRDDGTVVKSHATTFDNPHLPPAALEEMRLRLDGTRLGRQELYGELIAEAEGALWRVEWIVQEQEPLNMVRTCIGVDPAGSHKASSDRTGIVVAGEDSTGKYWALEDASGHYTPSEWAQRLSGLAARWKPNAICIERNFGGDLVRENVARNAPDVDWLITEVNASRGKAIRAEPVAGLYEQGRFWHVRGLEDLEREMLQWEPGHGKSPDRVDALVWAAHWLTSASANVEEWIPPEDFGENLNWEY